MRSSFPTLNATNLKTALVEGNKVISYAALNLRCDRFATGLLRGKADLEEERIAFFMPASIDYVTTMQGIWRAGWHRSASQCGLGGHRTRALFDLGKR